MTESAFFQDLAMLMSVAGFVAVVFARFGWPKVMGYILAGVVMSEYTWGGCFLADTGSTRTIGQLGVVFLMFAMGLSFSARDMKQIRSVALPSAVLDTVVMIWLGYTVGMNIFGWSAVRSLFFGVAICDSATTLLAKVIGERHWEGRRFAKYVIGTSVCEDIICVGAIAVATGFARGNGLSAVALLCSLGWLAVFFLTVLVFGFILLPRLLKSVGKKSDDEALLLTVLGACFFISFFAYKFDYSLALGAFLVGIVAASSDVRHRLAGLMDPLKSMFSAVFFVTIGLVVDPNALLHCLPHILFVSLLIVIGKFVNNFVASLATGLDIKSSVQNGFALAQTGEFAFMVAILYAGIEQTVDNPMFEIAVGASLVTTLLNPTMIRLSDGVGDFVERNTPARFKEGLCTYHAWLAKIRASTDSPAYALFKQTVLRLGVYAVLMLSVSAICAYLREVDFTRFSSTFQRYKEPFFFAIANLFSIALMPLMLSASKTLGDEVAVMLAGDGAAKWQLSVRQLVRFVMMTVVLGLFFVEWSMINVSVLPVSKGLQGISAVVIICVGVVGWRFFVKAGRRATQRFNEALTADERREGLERMTTVAVPDDTLHRLTLGANSPAVGATVVTLDIRAKTGVTVVSVERGGGVYRNIGPEWEFRIGDTLIVLGERSQVGALKDLLGVI